MADIKGYNMPDDLYYHPDHSWAQVEGDRVTVGMYDFFQKEAGDIVFIDLPEEDEEVPRARSAARFNPASGSGSWFPPCPVRSSRSMRPSRTTPDWSTGPLRRRAGSSSFEPPTLKGSSRTHAGRRARRLHRKGSATCRGRTGESNDCAHTLSMPEARHPASASRSQL